MLWNLERVNLVTPHKNNGCIFFPFDQVLSDSQQQLSRIPHVTMALTGNTPLLELEGSAVSDRCWSSQASSGTVESPPQIFDIHVKWEHVISIRIKPGNSPHPIYSTASKRSVLPSNSHIIVFRGDSRDSLVANIDFHNSHNIAAITYAATQANISIAAPVQGVSTSFIVADGGARRAFSWQNNQGDHPWRHKVVDEKGEVWADIIPNTHGKGIKFAELKIVKSDVREDMLDQIVVSGIALLLMEVKRQKKNYNSEWLEAKLQKKENGSDWLETKRQKKDDDSEDLEDFAAAGL